MGTLFHSFHRRDSSVARSGGSCRDRVRQSARHLVGERSSAALPSLGRNPSLVGVLVLDS